MYFISGYFISEADWPSSSWLIRSHNFPSPWELSCYARRVEQLLAIVGVLVVGSDSIRLQPSCHETVPSCSLYCGDEDIGNTDTHTLPFGWFVIADWWNYCNCLQTHYVNVHHVQASVEPSFSDSVQITPLKSLLLSITAAATITHLPMQTRNADNKAFNSYSSSCFPKRLMRSSTTKSWSKAILDIADCSDVFKRPSLHP